MIFARDICCQFSQQIAKKNTEKLAMALPVHSPGSPASTLYTTIHLSESEDMEKRRRKRTIIGADQLSKLESLYKQEQWPNRERKEKLAKEIGMSTHFVNIWFQNKRSRMKKMAQEEAELAVLRKEENGHGTCTSDTGHAGIAGSEKDENQSLVSTSKSSPGPTLRPIAPKSPATPMSKIKPGFPTEQKISPQVVCVKLPLVAQSLSPKIPKQYPVPVPDIAQTITVSVTGNECNKLTSSVEASALCEAPKSCEMETQQSLSPASWQVKVLAQQSLQQADVLHTSQQQGQQPQPQQKPAQVRFGTNPAVVLNKLPLSRHALLDTDTEASSEENTSTSESTNPPATYSLFECLVAMAAVEEGGGIIQKDDPNYDMAVNSTLYGIKVEDDMQEKVLTYDKKTGLRFNETDDVEM
ncbi:uncharacterized protein [Amphiura filiformis]|uniref:uncharacterized protein n=1 Tax=Amphiura filiformis TaxID=82378 RepID=UPI003B220626